MSEKSHVLVVDDDAAMCSFLRAFLTTRGYGAVAVMNGEEAVRHFHAERPAAVLLDLVMPGTMDGLAALASFKKIDKDIPVIVISGQGRTNVVVQAMKLGATDFVCKPFEEAELEVLLSNAIRQRLLSREVASLREQLKDQSQDKMLFGHSEAMSEVRELIERVSDTDVTVLVRGESGTGKELVARAIHAASLRKDKPFVKVNCAALPTELLESELFGFEKGAFTGAIQHKPGKFEFANHGTIFLDEIGEMTPALQAKLLQVLQDGEFSRLGGKADVSVDVRVITATNRDLEQAVANGDFREDLYFRLNVVTINLPPLRERREEVPVLTDYFLKKYAVQYNKPITTISPDLANRFLHYDWPGNVRQLENLIKRMVVLGSEAPILKELQHSTHPFALRAASPLAVVATAPVVPEAVAVVAPAPVAVAAPAVAAVALPSSGPAGNCSLKDIARTAAREAERELILQMLTRTRWNRKQAAEILGISYKALLYKIKENGLDKAS